MCMSQNEQPCRTAGFRRQLYFNRSLLKTEFPNIAIFVGPIILYYYFLHLGLAGEKNVHKNHQTPSLMKALYLFKFLDFLLEKQSNFPSFRAIRTIIASQSNRR